MNIFDLRRLWGRQVPSWELTSESVWKSRRRWLRSAAHVSVASLAAPAAALPSSDAGRTPLARAASRYSSPEHQTPQSHAESYNNYYEFGTDKADPSREGHRLQVQPWQVAIEGLVSRPQMIDLEALMKVAALEERVYRLRCVEGWSMVIPWVGYSLKALIDRVQPLGSAKFVEFYTAALPDQMPGLRSRVLDWPYVEGLRLDEALNPLSLLSFGAYGQTLAAQNGAPVRLVVPWKYGFKSAKSIVKIRFVEQQPRSSWMRAAPHEYGFYSNVNPAVNHPRWSQATERRLGEDGLFKPKRKTLPFNGYGEWVEAMYRDMDLRRHF